jgi:hypothetical protein
MPKEVKGGLWFERCEHDINTTFFNRYTNMACVVGPNVNMI